MEKINEIEKNYPNNIKKKKKKEQIKTRIDVTKTNLKLKKILKLNSTGKEKNIKTKSKSNASKIQKHVWPRTATVYHAPLLPYRAAPRGKVSGSVAHPFQVMIMQHGKDGLTMIITLQHHLYVYLYLR